MEQPAGNIDPEILKLKAEIKDLDKRLIGQEHRLFHIISNLYKYGFDTRDKDRFRQAGISLVSFFLKRQTVIIATAALASILSLASVIVSIQSRNLLEDQNEKIEYQNKRIIQQNQLLEADRRSSLVFLFNNVMDALDNELKSQKKISDSIISKNPYVIGNISKQLTGRIIALSRRLLPYRAYDYETDSLGPLASPERGQLLINILESEIIPAARLRIYTLGDFSYATIGDFEIKDEVLSLANLSYSNLAGAELSRSAFGLSNLSYANFTGADLSNTDCFSTNFANANFTNAKLKEAKFRAADLSFSILNNTDFTGAELDYTIFHITKSDTMISHNDFIQYLKLKSVIGWERIDSLYKFTRSFEKNKINPSDSMWYFRLVPRF